MNEAYTLTIKAQINIIMNGYSGIIHCAFCGRREVMSVLIEAGVFTLPDGWHYVFNSEDHTARVMCDKCFNQYD